MLSIWQLRQGIFLDSLIIAKVILIFKQGCRSSSNNFRRISFLSALSKIFERYIFDQVTFYIPPNTFVMFVNRYFRYCWSKQYAERVAFELRNRPRSPQSLCGSVVEHRSAESEGLGFVSSWGLRIFSLSHARDKKNSIFLLFFTGLKFAISLILFTN